MLGPRRMKSLGAVDAVDAGAGFHAGFHAGVHGDLRVLPHGLLEPAGRDLRLRRRVLRRRQRQRDLVLRLSERVSESVACKEGVWVFC